MNLLEVHDITKKFGSITALNKLSFSIKKGQIVGLIGPNGSGKSTFFNALMNVFPKDGGKIIFDGTDISNLQTYQIARLGISRTFQDSKPLEQISIADNIETALRYPDEVSLLNTFFKWKSFREEHAGHQKVIYDALKKVNIERKRHHLAQDVSYGQGKLLEILKVMVADSKLILLDEPFSGLFPEMIKMITNLIYSLVEEGKTIILVEHNMKLISEITDHIIVFDAGKKIAEGRYEEVTKDPLVVESYLGK